MPKRSYYCNTLTRNTLSTMNYDDVLTVRDSTSYSDIIIPFENDSIVLSYNILVWSDDVLRNHFSDACKNYDFYFIQFTHGVIFRRYMCGYLRFFGAPIGAIISQTKM